MNTAAFEDAFAAALLDPALQVPPGIVKKGGRSDAGRFAIHRNNVAIGLAKALAGNFPVLERLVGASFFRALAHAYVGARRPSSPLLFEYGGDFADFITGFEPAAALPYLADIARLEFARLAAYHAADAEPLGIAALAELDAATLASARLLPHPAAAAISSPFPVGSIWLAHRSDPVETITARGGERILLTRPQLEVHVTVLAKREFHFALALLSGAPIGEAAEQVFDTNHSVFRQRAADEPGFDFGRAIVSLVSLGAFSGILQQSTETSP